MTKPLFSQKQIYEFIRRHEPFSQLSNVCLYRVADALEIESPPGNSLLIKKGDKMSDLYIVLQGRLYFQVTDEHDNVTFQGEFNEGAIIGEMALLSGLPRSANVYTLRDSIILRLTKKNFIRLSALYPELLNKITQFTIQRLTNSLQGIDTTVFRNKSIALVCIKPIEDLEFKLEEMIAKFPYGEKILLLSKEFMLQKKTLLDEDGNISSDGILWINHQEMEYSFIFYLAEDTLSNWTKFCIRQADSIAFLAIAEHNEFGLSPVERYIYHTREHFIKRSILMLLHESSALPKNSQYWLQKRTVTSHHHARYDTDAGSARMMRIFTDNTVSLVLSGGGARAMAHIGFCRLLDERKIHFDYIAGTSMGAIIAAAFAMGYNAREAMDIVHEHLIRGSKIDFTFPYIAIASGKRVTNGLAHIFGEKNRIEDLWLNFFCVSTDLISQDLFVHDRGLLWESIRSSMSLPFIYPPVSLDDKLLMDGGILNNIPTDIMRQHTHCSKIIACNIMNNNVFKLNPLPYSLSGWKLLYNKMMGREPILPMNLVELVHRLLTISSHKNTEKMLAMADYTICLNENQFGLMDFKRYKSLDESGYKQGKIQFAPQNMDELLNKNGC